jgi:predicted alpha/beta-hydrolase family hydrolase
MATTTTLSILGNRGEAVPNRFLRPEGAIDHLAVLLPGFGYTLDMPLFYYAENLLLDRGWDVLRVEYAYNTRPEYQALPEPERDRWLLEDATAAWRAALDQRTYERVVLIGKSLGTLAMGHLLTAPDSPSTVGAIWLTPLLSEERLRQQIRGYGGPSLFVIGTADPHFDPVVLEEMQVATIGEAVVVKNADHGMDIPGDPIASVRALERVVEALCRFLSRPSQPGD